MAGRDPLGPDPRLGALIAARERIESLIGRPFTRPELLREALTHRSALKSRGRGKSATTSNERLEFIGDRVLGLLIAEWLFERFPHEQEGALGLRLAYLVSRPVLVEIAGRIGIDAALDVAPNESRAGVRQVANVLADAFEAVLGATYLDGGIEPARHFVRAAFDDTMEGQLLPPKDPKTELQEWLQGRGMQVPAYQMESSEGPSHAPVFVIRVSAAGRSGVGTAGSKRVAESAAAADLLGQLQ